MISPYDLHSHSTASDGALSPADLVCLAAETGVTHLALTDHDSVAGIQEAIEAAHQHSIQLIPGVEISVTWEKKCFHVLGLHINPDAASLAQGLKRLQILRRERAEKMDANLEKHGIRGALQEVRAMAGEGMITRTHFARFLVSQGYAKDMADVFEKFLVRGKPGYVATQWADLEEALAWILKAGGIAVLAHPLRYKLTGAWLRRFLTAFRSNGGAGIEVVCGNSTPVQIETCADYARRYRLMGSVGSDFHDPAFPWIELGNLAPLPPGVTPVWESWRS